MRLLPLLLGLLVALPSLAADDVTLPKVTTRAKGSRLGGILPTPQPCPEGVPADVECMAGQDYLGAWFWMARPKDWNGVLVLHTHDNPELAEPTEERPARDMVQWSIWLRAGYAWAGSSFRAAGYDAESAAEDSERVRSAFIADFGEPKRVLLHGHGWGAPVATRMAQRFTTPDIHPRRIGSGKRPYDGVLLTNGQLGGSRHFDTWLDLRVIYQALCANHPAANETPYPVWMGLPVNGKLTQEGLAQRVNDCTGLQRPPAERTSAQQKTLATLVRLSRVPEAGLLRQLEGATWGLQHLVWHQLGGKSALGNEGITYGNNAGNNLGNSAAGDAALNQQLPRYKLDAQARATLDDLTDPGTGVHIPVLSMHAVDDPVVFVEQESRWRAGMTEAGNIEPLLQLYAVGQDHDRLPDAQLLSAASQLLSWIDSGQKPAPTAVARACGTCRWLPDYRVAELNARVPERRAVATRPTTPQVLSAPSMITPPPRPAAPPREPLPAPASP